LIASSLPIAPRSALTPASAVAIAVLGLAVQMLGESTISIARRSWQ